MQHVNLSLSGLALVKLSFLSYFYASYYDIEFPANYCHLKLGRGIAQVCCIFSGFNECIKAFRAYLMLWVEKQNEKMFVWSKSLTVV